MTNKLTHKCKGGVLYGYDCEKCGPPPSDYVHISQGEDGNDCGWVAPWRGRELIDHDYGDPKFISPVQCGFVSSWTARHLMPPGIEHALSLSIKSVCGRRLIYPMCEKSKELAKIARTGTLLFESIPHIQKLGFHIQWEGLTNKDEERLRELGVEM